MTGRTEGDAPYVRDGLGAGVGQAAEHRGAAAGVLQAPGESVPVLTGAGEDDADLLRLRAGAQVGVEKSGVDRAVLALEDQVLHLAGEAQGGDLGLGRKRCSDRGPCGAKLVGGILLRAAVRAAAGGVLGARGGERAPVEVDQSGFRGRGAEVEGEEAGHGRRVCGPASEPFVTWKAPWILR